MRRRPWLRGAKGLAGSRDGLSECGEEWKRNPPTFVGSDLGGLYNAPRSETTVIGLQCWVSGVDASSQEETQLLAPHDDDHATTPSSSIQMRCSPPGLSIRRQGPQIQILNSRQRQALQGLHIENQPLLKE